MPSPLEKVDFSNEIPFILNLKNLRQPILKSVTTEINVFLRIYK